MFVNFCFARGHPLRAHAIWSDGTTWPKSLGSSEASEILEKHVYSQHWSTQALPSNVQLRPRATGACLAGTELEILDNKGGPMCLSRRH